MYERQGMPIPLPGGSLRSIVSEPGADRGPRAGSPRGVVVATESTTAIGALDPVATAPGTDRSPLGPPATAGGSDQANLFFQSEPATILSMHAPRPMLPMRR